MTDFFPELYHCIEDQDADADADAGEGVLDDGQIGKVLDKGGNDRDDDQDGNTTPRVAMNASGSITSRSFLTYKRWPYSPQ